VWAFGQLDSNNEPAFHTYYPKSDIVIDFNTTEPVNDCFAFTKQMETPPPQLWERTRMLVLQFENFLIYMFNNVINRFRVICDWKRI